MSNGSAIPVSHITSGSLKFVPTAFQNSQMPSTPVFSFNFKVKDDGGTASNGLDTDQADRTAAFTVTSVPTGPIGTPKAISIPEDTTLTIVPADFGFQDPNDNPADKFKSVVITTVPASTPAR